MGSPGAGNPEEPPRWPGRLAAAVRAVPRALREDLWTSAAEPPRRLGRSRLLDWWPAFMVPLVLFSVFLLVSSVDQYSRDYRMSSLLALLLAAVQSAALVAAPFRPVAAWWASTGALVGLALFADPLTARATTLYPWTGAGITLEAWVLFLVALRSRPRVAAEVLVISVLAGLLRTGHLNRTVVLLFVIAVVLGAALRGRQVARTELVAQEEITAEERARRTLLEERHRIARELHDVVAHHMAVISIQAQAAPHLAENPSQELRENLAGIRENAVGALTELRRVLGVLRSEDALGSGDSLADGVRHAPQPTLDRLDELLGNVRGAGVGVTRRTTGEPRPLPPGVELSAFRIVQEALSNAMRHAPGAEVRVETAYHRSGVTVRVTNTAPAGTAPPSPGTGHGLLGMRERVAMLGGELATGATPEGGWEVTATLPTTPLGPAEPDGSAAGPSPAGSSEDTV
ncbi:sensor histidine kinase [Streptomyces sp. GMY02]|uniref:sensor histidine kinase n=1 Tax=Streptomyces sp. GMY02 TaxID=1333528 RepID=UPI001C2BDBD7|nr:sensor histidine kinase [Streptomyces sp. GMY02]QXE37778.1 sensor histidine kinase [Streptomyces sp. GMY02]